MKISTYNNRTLSLLVLLMAFVLCPSFLSAQNYGLQFRGRYYANCDRTELNLTPDCFFQFQNEFEISFDYKASKAERNPGQNFFGYILRIVNENDENIDLLSAPNPNKTLNLVIGKSNSLTSVHYSDEYINQWIKLRVKFLLAEDRLIFYTPDSVCVLENVGLEKEESYKIIFGANHYKQFKNVDVPLMNIKDIEIFEEGELKYYWPLDEAEGNIAEDRLEGEKANVINPSWLIKKHQGWEQKYIEDIPRNVFVTSDEEADKIFMVGDNELTIYHTRNNTVSKVRYKNQITFLDRPFRAIYNSSNNKIYFFRTGTMLLYVLDVETGAWDHAGSKPSSKTNYLRNNSYYYNQADSSLYLFGGYRNYQYTNSIRKIDLFTNNWQELPTNDSIFSPRYHAGIGALNDTLYILGGYGSFTGSELINPQSCFDMFGFSIKDSSLFFKFEIPHFLDDMVVGNSIWINDKNRDYYALAFSKNFTDENIRLIKGNLDSPIAELVGDKIQFKDIGSEYFVNLYYNSIQDKLFAYTSKKIDSTTQIAIYSINNPPNSILSESYAPANKKGLLIIMIAVVLLVIFGLFIWLYLGKKQENKASRKVEVKEDLAIEETIVFEQPKYNLVFFGGFQVYDKDLVDITQNLSPLLKELFLLILLHTFKDSKGISSEKITQILWHDKSPKSAKNNRAVNNTKLRVILDEIGDCKLLQKMGYWKIIFNDSSIKSDYVDFLSITGTKNNLTKQKIIQLIEITRKGSFLSYLNYDWLDEFKASVSDTIIDTLVCFGKTCDVNTEPDFIILLADSIFNFDIINEHAMILKCKAQYCTGKHSRAKATYEKFLKEYIRMYGQEYNQSFLDVLEIREYVNCIS